jgi:hypothetical protein
MEISVSQSRAIKNQLSGAIVPEFSELGTGRSREKSVERKLAFYSIGRNNFHRRPSGSMAFADIVVD